MKAKKLPSGTWRVLVYLGTDSDGKKLLKSITAETKAEAEYLARDYQLKYKRGAIKKNEPVTLRQAIQRYINISEVLAPSTINGYEIVMNYRFPSIMDLKLTELTQDKCQEAINIESRSYAPKTVHNAWGLVATVLKKNGIIYNDIKLPRKTVKHKEFPMPNEIFEAIKGTDIELPCLLAMWLSLTMSEIRGIDCSAIRGDVLSIEKVKVYVKNEDHEKRSGKTSYRIRRHRLPEYLMNLVINTESYQEYLQTKQDGPLITFKPYSIYKRWKKIAIAHGWEMSFHDLRAESASIMLMLGIPDKYAAERGGWTPSSPIMKTVYQQTFSEQRLLVDEKINDYFEQFIK